MKKSFKESILKMSNGRFEKLKHDLKNSWNCHGFSKSPLVAWVVSQIDLRKHKDGMTAEEILAEINKIRK